MATWEYKRITVKTKGGTVRKIEVMEDYVEVMNAAGRDGWEFVEAIALHEERGRTSAIDLVFKRPR